MLSHTEDPVRSLYSFVARRQVFKPLVNVPYKSLKHPSCSHLRVISLNRISRAWSAPAQPRTRLCCNDSTEQRKRKHLPNSKSYSATFLKSQIPIRLDLQQFFKVTRFRQLAPNRGVVTIFTAATDMIKSLYCHNNMLQELHDLPHPEPDHGATAAFDCHLAQCSLADSQWGNDHVDERQHYSVDPWNLPLTAFPDCPTSFNGVAMSGNRSFRH